MSEPKLISICFKFLGIIYQDLTWEDENGLETGQKASMTQHQSDQIIIFKLKVFVIQIFYNLFEQRQQSSNSYFSFWDQKMVAWFQRPDIIWSDKTSFHGLILSNGQTIHLLLWKTQTMQVRYKLPGWSHILTHSIQSCWTIYLKW